MADKGKSIKIYIAGKITGEPRYLEKFKAAETRLQKLGCIVLNPACLPERMTSADYMRICFSMIDSADAVVLIPGWETSRGAELEKKYCEYIGKPVSYGIEAAQGYADCHVDMDCTDCPALENAVERLAAYEDTGLEPDQVEDLKRQRWIPCSEKMPEEKQRVLFWVESNEAVYTGFYSYTGRQGTHWFRGGKSNYAVKFWMPLPEPPEEGEQQDEP